MLKKAQTNNIGKNFSDRKVFKDIRNEKESVRFEDIHLQECYEISKKQEYH